MSIAEKAMAPHSSTLAWKIPWTGEPGRLQSMGLLRVGSCRDQEGRRRSKEMVLGTSVFPSSETSMLGNFWGRIKGAKYCFALQDGTWDYS